ncbi:MAG: RNA-guided endonuclease IscB [Rivularia sp. (in: cyanobacteria)]
MQSVKPNKVFLVDTNKQPLNPITAKQARKLLEKGKAAVFRQFPFTLILKTAVENPLIYPLTLKLDPGSKFSGISILSGSEIIWCAEIEHRGYLIKQSLESRRAIRRGRRNRKTRYRKARFNNRKRKEGWLPPSLLHRVQTTETWVKRLIKFAPIQEIWIESVKFDLSKMQNPEITGKEYQQGTLFGYEVREYLLEKWNRKCAYCGAYNIPLQIEHIHPKSKGGSDRVSNLTIACEKCNQKKGNKPVEQFLSNKQDLLKTILQQAKKPLRDAAAVNSTRNKIVEVLENILPVSKGTGAQTKQNRIRLDLPKEHWVDSACIGKIDNLIFRTNQPLKIKSTGHGTRQKVITDRFGFPSKYRPQSAIFFGFKTGDIIKAVIVKGQYVGNWLGRVAVRKTGNFRITVKGIKPFDVNHKNCIILHKADGYNYAF